MVRRGTHERGTLNTGKFPGSDWQLASQRIPETQPGCNPLPTDGPLGDAQDIRRLGLRQPFVPEQVEELTRRRSRRSSSAIDAMSRPPQSEVFRF
jgi:hypothetical protein